MGEGNKQWKVYYFVMEDDTSPVFGDITLCAPSRNFPRDTKIRGVHYNARDVREIYASVSILLHHAFNLSLTRI